jgi:hypothetical protein
MEAPKSWSQFRGLPGAVALWGNKASNKPHRREVQEASSDSVWLDGRQPVLLGIFELRISVLSRNDRPEYN